MELLPWATSLAVGVFCVWVAIARDFRDRPRYQRDPNQPMRQIPWWDV